ncbi:hypothetical protein PSCICL_28280 [Pseudomonas cichorii]|nr:hypothetical protein PSCICL_28280 [Pseudomonas cichorii]
MSADPLVSTIFTTSGILISFRRPVVIVVSEASVVEQHRQLTANGLSSVAIGAFSEAMLAAMKCVEEELGTEEMGGVE